ncbi:hypothetical protein LCGC14_1816040, partial [marine sediment metagenome]
LIVQSKFGNHFIQTRLEDLAGGPMNNYDILFCSATLEHIPMESIRLVLKNFSELLAPGGVAYIEVDTKPDSQRDLPEESHVNIRPWDQWLLNIYSPGLPWTRDESVEASLKGQIGFPGFPLPDWSFTVARMP